MIKFLPPAFFILLLQFGAINQTSAQTGTWTEVATTAPHENFGVMLLLTDGTVICHNINGGNYGTGWDKLTPDASGSYVNGTWSSISSMEYDRLYFSSQVLPDGNVYVAGGEYGSGGPYGEVYNPLTNNWTECGSMPSGDDVYDGSSEILYDGDVLQGVVIPTPSIENLFYTPTTNSYTSAPNSLYSHDEAAWLKLPDSSVLFVGIASTNSCRYIPQLNKWVNDGTVPVNIYDIGEESGAVSMLPNGNAIFFGATQYNAFYTPNGDTVPGTWTAAADFPTIQGTPVGQSDAPGAMMVNGHILCAASPVGTASGEYYDPVYFVEYDYTTNTFTQVKSAIPGIGGDSIPDNTCYEMNMLDLPDGTVLVAMLDYSTYFVYTPGSAPIAQGKPTINSIIPDGCPNYKITGKLFNGISEGASYGDDWQMETNYPIVRLSNGTDVYYARTSLWNRIGAVQTDSLEDTAVFTLPSIPPGTYSLVVVVNGFASNPVLFGVLGASLISQTNLSCGSSEGSATVSASGGTAPYTYSWSGGAGSGTTASNLGAGDYTVTVTDNNLCIATLVVIISGSSGVSLTAVTAGVSCYGNGNGSVSAEVSGGTAPFTYSWSGSGLTTVFASGLSVGTYTVTVSDSCGYSATAYATITQPATLTGGIASLSEPSCFGSYGSVTAGVSGGTSPYTYLWNNGATNAAASLSAGSYTVTITDKNGCLASDSVTLTQPSVPLSVSAGTVANARCNGENNGSVSSTASGGVSPYTYFWSGGGTQPVYTGLSAGTYTLKITDNNGCTASAATSITQPAALLVSANAAANNGCNGGNNGSASSTVSGGISPYTYSWSGGGTQPVYSGLSVGTYTLEIADNNGCTASASVSITQSNVIISTRVISNVSCNDGANGIILSSVSGGTEPYTFRWAGSYPNVGTNALVDKLTAGTYTVYVLDNSGCPDSATATLTQPAPIIVKIDSINVKLSTSDCNGEVAISEISGGVPPYVYLWTGERTTDTIFNLCKGAYCCKVTDSSGCVDSACVDITTSTGIDNPDSYRDGQLLVYPNPNNGVFAIAFGHAEFSSASQTIIEIYNVLGQEVYKTSPPDALVRTTSLTPLLVQGEGKVEINLSSQPNGIYFYRVLTIDDKLIGEGKVIIEK